MPCRTVDIFDRKELVTRDSPPGPYGDGQIGQIILDMEGPVRDLNNIKIFLEGKVTGRRHESIPKRPVL
jgi:hypothetical protein